MSYIARARCAELWMESLYSLSQLEGGSDGRRKRRKTGRCPSRVGTHPGYGRGITGQFQWTSGSLEQNISIHNGGWQCQDCFHGATRRCHATSISNSRDFIPPRCAFSKGLDCSPALRTRRGRRVICLLLAWQAAVEATPRRLDSVFGPWGFPRCACVRPSR